MTNFMSLSKFKLNGLIFVRNYRPAVDASHQLKISAIRDELQAIGIATGRSRAKRNKMSAGTGAVSIEEAIEQLKKSLAASSMSLSASANKNSTEILPVNHSVIINAQVKLLKEQSNGLRGILDLPHPELLNARPSILVFATPQQAALARSAGANIVGGEELINDLITGNLAPFNRCLATTAMMSTVMKVARVLGPKGLMPNIKTGTLVEGSMIGEAVKKCFQAVPFKIEKNAGLMNMAVGSVNGDIALLKDNIGAVIDHVLRLGTTAQKQQQQQLNRRYIQRLYLSMRGFPGIQVNF